MAHAHYHEVSTLSGERNPLDLLRENDKVLFGDCCSLAMDVDNSASDGNSSPHKHKDGADGHQVNGMSNGYSSKHKSHKSDHKDRHKDRDKSSRSSKDHKSSSKDRHSSSNKDKERHSSSHKSSSKDKDRHKDKDKDKERDKHKSSSGSSSRDKDREHKSSKDKDRSEHKSSSGSSSRDKDKDKHRHSSSKDKHRDKERDKDKHSSSRDKERSKDKDRKSDRHEKKIKDEPEPEPVESPKEESMDEDDLKLVIKEEEDEYETTNNLNNSQSSCDYSMSQFKDDPKTEMEEDEQDEADGGGEVESEEDIPLSARMATWKEKKRKIESEDEEDEAPARRKKPKKEKNRREIEDSDEGEYAAPPTKRVKKEKKEKKSKASKKDVKVEESPSPKKRKKKDEEEQEVWQWWKEEKREDGVKWKFLEHKGPVFAPPYERLPSKVKFLYDGREITLSDEAEEVAGFYAKMLDHDYTTKEAFNNNFFKDWRRVMSDEERRRITDLRKCNFKPMHTYFTDLAEKNRNRTKEEKKELKEKNEAVMKEFGFCTIDGHKEKIGNFKIEPPGLFRGRGEHPKMGMLKRRVQPEDVLINCSKDSVIPKPPPGHKWKEVRHDPAVTWLASWTENVQNQVKYVMLNPSSKLKGEKDWAKYETARRLKECIDKIRNEYRDDWKSKEMRIRQRAVALYFIDRLALRAGNEKDEDQADTVGCCSLRVEHIQLHAEKDDKEYVVVFDFLGKDSIRYYNEVPVEKRVFKNLQLFMENKSPGDDLFDRLNTAVMNKHLNELMDGLTAKVFRTYNASYTLQQQLDMLTNADDTVAEKILSYNRANRAVAILCNHQRSIPKGHQKSMEKLKEKIDAKRDAIADAERQVKDAQKDAKKGSVKEKILYDKKKKQLERLRDQLAKLEIQETDRDENKTIALGTSKLNYLDPRISVAWCKKYDVPIEKIYNKTQRDKFRWAIDMAGPDFVF